MKRFVCLIALLLPACQMPGENPASRPATEQIRNDVYWLADDAREGRLSGTPGAQASATYLAQRFSALGLEPLPALGSFRQPFTITWRVQRSATMPSANDPTTQGNGTTQPIEPASAENIVARQPGAGSHKDEYIIVGAHYDHIGRGKFSSRKPESGEIHNGADDNASGAAALLAVASRLANRRLDRSVIFVAFSGEESGLHGSRYFVNHSPIPLDKVTAMINLDMVGRVRNHTLFVGGGGTRPAFAGLLEQADERSPLQLKSIGQGGFGPSDHMSFASKKIPVLFLFSGLHQQYHHPDDDAWRINYEGLDQVAALATDLAVKLAALPKEPYVSTFDHQWMQMAAETTTQPTTQKSGVGQASLGVVPDYGSEQSDGGVRISGTSPGTPAEQARLKEGDILTGFGGRPINNLYDLSDLLKKASPGDEVEVRYLRAGKQESVRLRLAERKGQR